VAAHYFRIFNPELQAKKFDTERLYRDRFLAKGRRLAHSNAMNYFEAVPKSWALTPDQPYPRPIIELSTGK
jgi:deoxyribodipyrimidine photo-lyase